MKKKMQDKNYESKKLQRENETEELRKERQDKIKERMKWIRQNETLKQKQKRQERNKCNMSRFRANSSELNRLIKFKEAVKYGPIFTCTVCDQDMFINNVSILTEALEKNLHSKSSELCSRVLIGMHPISIRLDESPKFYICSTCKNDLKNGKLPAMARANTLQVVPLDDKDLRLSELESNLIARTLLFQKIYQLPKSRMAACKDRLINIPINSEDIQNTLANLPRTPREAGLLEAKLKSKLEYKNTHQQAYIDPAKIYKALDFLKKSGHPDYAFYDDLNTYEGRCKSSDIEVTVLNDSDVETIVEKDVYLKSLKLEQFGEPELTDGEESEDEDSDEEEELYKKNDVIRKFQFDYNRSVCLVDKFPEAAVTEEAIDDTDQISFAPGEGKIPQNILSSKDWDLKAFPMKHPDGKNNLHQQRERKLTDQYYFVQRLRNTDTRFSCDPAYVFAAAAYLEKKQLQRNVNVSYQRGKETQATNGISTFHLDDGFSVFGNISNTPRYWKTAKHEMLAKLDNLGPFQFFFTLSCADRRWDENFSSILRKLGLTIEYETTKDGIEQTWIKSEEHTKMPMKQYLEQHVDQSLHEMIRQHVFLATRNYNNRVRSFIRDIVTNKNNPMCVKHWTTKVEFQGRGAGHNHGVIWVDMEKMELTFIEKDGCWGNLENYLKSSKNKVEIKNDLRKLLTKHFVKGENFEEDDVECLQKIYHQIFQIEDDQTYIEENSESFVHSFLNKFKLFGLSAAFKKFQTKEDLLDHEERAVIVFTNKFTTCTLNEKVIEAKTDDIHLKEKSGEVIDIVKQCYIHSHTRSCRKYHTECRFFFPKFPIWRTILSKPMKASGEEGKALREKYDKVLKDVREVLKDQDVITMVLEKIPKTQDVTIELYEENRRKRIVMLLSIAGLITESDILLYEEALTFSSSGYAIHLERDLDEIYVNSYNPEWARAWNGNTDLQVCLDYFAVITYITEYFAKDDTGLMTKLVEMVKNSECETLQEKMILVMNSFITARQMGECEAYYKILPEFHLKDSNITTLFVPTSRKNLRSKFMIKVDENEAYNGREKKKIENREGWFVEKYDLIDKYVRLDKNCKEIDELSSSQFLKMYVSAHNMGNKKNKNINVKDESDNDDEEMQTEEECIWEGDEKFHYVMTAKQDGKIPLPDYIAIENPFPGEPPFMRKRTKPAVLRFHKPKQSINPEDYFFSEALLYTPFKSEEELENRVKDAAMDGFKTLEKQINAVKAQVMEHLESNEEARYLVEEATNKIKEMGENLDPQGEQDIRDCELEDLMMHPDYQHLNPDDVDITEKAKFEKRYRPIEIEDLKILSEKTKNMDFYQRKVVQTGIDFARKVVKARANKNKMPSAINVIVHGGAGCGKSTVINILKQWCQLILQQAGDDPDCPYILVAAPTGTAAAKVFGQTMHTAFGFNFGNEHYSLSDKVRDKKRNLLRNLKIVIIDEISMVKSDQGFQLDKRLREVLQRPAKIFGGVALFYFGDVMQLPPCMGRYIFDEPINQDYKLEYQLGLHWEAFEVIILEENHRQGEDHEYADMLNRFRIGQQTEKDMQRLQTRVRPLDHPDTKDAVFISCKNKAVNKLNNFKLNELKEEKVVIEAINTHSTIQNFKPTVDKDKLTVKDTPFLQTLELKKGARVQLTYNIDTLDCLTNGARGYVVDFLRNGVGIVDKIMIRFEESHQGKQKQESQPDLTKQYPGCTSVERVMFQYSLAKKSKSVSNTAKVIQFPLSLCFAATAHRFQGQTVHKPNKTVNDFRTVFVAAQAYVMLSRVETLNQLFVLGSLPDNKFYASHKALKELERLNKVSVNKNPPLWEQNLDKSIKIMLLNCRSLRLHIDELRKDPIIAYCDVICLNETWLIDNTLEDGLAISGYDLHLNSMGVGKGIGTYYKAQKIVPKINIAKPKAQLTLLSSTELDLVNIYRSKGMDNKELVQDLKDIINTDKFTVICGDMNMCYIDERNNEVTRMLNNNGFVQLVHEATHFKGGNIDHVYSNHNTSQFQVEVSLYSPHYLCRDHDAICVTVTRAPGQIKSYGNYSSITNQIFNILFAGDM